MKVTSYKQLGEKLKDTTYNTVNYDVTTKSVGRLIDVLVSTGEGSFILGLKQGVDGTADTYVEAVQASFKAVEMHIPDADLNILGSISNTMNETAEHRRQVFQQVQTRHHGKAV